MSDRIQDSDSSRSGRPADGRDRFPADQDTSSGAERKHPILFYWLTAGAATIIVALIGTSVASSSSHANSPGQNTAATPGGDKGNGGGDGGDGPSAYQGSWAGVVSYPTIGATADMTLILNSGQVGAEIGQWANATLDCSGTVTLETGGDTLSLHLVTTDNAGNVCVSQADAQVSQADGGIAIVIQPDFGAVPGSGTLTSTN